MKKILALVLAAVLCMAIFAGCAPKETPDGTGDSGKKTYTIGFAVSTLANDFFVTMNDAGRAYAKEVGIELVTLDAQDSSETQATQVEDLITKHVDLIILNPVDSDAIGTSVMAANQANIPVITVTRPSNSGKVVQHLDIDNKEAGALVAEQLAKDLNYTGKVAVLEGIAGAPSSNDRQKGFVEKLAEVAPNIKVVTSLTANYSREEGSTVTEDILQSNPELDAIYAHNDEMALGAVRAVDAAGRADKIKIYGIDAVADALAALKSGQMDATVQQQPDLQIRTAIDSALKVLKGESVDAMVNIPLKLITE